MAELGKLRSQPKEQDLTTLQKLESFISKKIKLRADMSDPVASRKVALRSLKLGRNEMKQIQAERDQKAEVAENNRKIDDLEVIEQQYTTYFQNLTQKNNVVSAKSQEKAFERYVSNFKMRDETKELVKLKARTPFRINIDDFENKKLNVVKYYEMIQSQENKMGSEESSCFGKSYGERVETDGNNVSTDDLAKYGRMITQPSLKVLPKQLVDERKITKKPSFMKSNSVKKQSKEMSAPLLVRDQNYISQNATPENKPDIDPYLTKYWSNTYYENQTYGERSTPKHSPRGQFLIRKSFRKIGKEDTSLASTMRSRFENLASMWDDQSAEQSKFIRKCEPLKCIKLTKYNTQKMSTTGKTFVTQVELSKSTLHKRTLRKIGKFGYTERSDWNISKDNEKEESQLPCSKPKKGHSVSAEYELSDEHIAALIAYTQQVRDQEGDASQKRMSINFKKQYRKLDTREKIDQEVKRMFDANFKGPGGKTAALLTSMLHHYISFGNPVVSKTEVTTRVKEFMEKYKVKITPAEIKKLAAERNFYITSIQ